MPRKGITESNVAGNTGGEKSGRQIQGGQPHHSGRGSAEQGPLQNAKGGPEGANQGGAPRGSSRLEPSHAHDMQKKDRVPKQGSPND